MVDVLSKSSNPKHRNSKFLKFLLKLNHGTYSLDEENKTLIKHPEMKEDFQKFYQDSLDKYEEEVKQDIDEEEKDEEVK